MRKSRGQQGNPGRGRTGKSDTQRTRKADKLEEEEGFMQKRGKGMTARTKL